MSWRRVGVIYLVLAGLVGYFALFERSAPTPTPTEGARALDRSLLGTEASAVEAVSFRRAGVEVHAVREGERWRVVAPADSAITPDLIAAVVATLTTGQSVEVMQEASDGDLAAFGLATPSSEIEVVLRAETTRKVRVLLGARNPTKTAVYARRDDQPAVYLVGLNVRYYEDLIFEAAARRSISG